MRPTPRFIVLLGFPGLALAAPMEGRKTDETYLRQQFEISQAQARETMRIREEKRKEFLERSRLGGDGDSCLAYAVETGDCSISAAEFDRSLVSHLPDSLEFQSGESLALKAGKARQSVFEELVDRAFLTAYRPEDSLRAPASEAGKRRADAPGFFDGFDMPALLKAFPRIRAQVFAASDSAWLAARLANPRGGILPVTLPAWELPDSIAALLAHFRRGEWTPVRRVPFGYLACSWLDTLPAPGLLAKIGPRLEQSGSKSGTQGRSRVLEAMHREGCQEEDTLGLSLRLAPARRGGAQEPGPAWLSAHSAVLPAAVKGRLWTKFDRGMPDTLGPIRSVYGTWMLALASRDVKPGRTLDSTACLARIEARMKQEENTERIRAAWEIISSKTGYGRSEDTRTALLEQLSEPGARPEAAYHKLRERWVSSSLRFTRDMGLPAASPETGNGNTP